MTHRIPRVNAVLIGSTIVLALLGTAFWLITPARMQVLDSNWDAYGAGGRCSNEPPFYDRQGRLQGFPFEPYTGNAPLYFPSWEDVEPLMTEDCVYPESVSPDKVINWPAVYPLVLDSELIPQLRTGESARLKITAIIQDHFSSVDYPDYYLIHIEPGEEINLKFDLDAPNFEYSQDARIAKLLVGRPSQIEWIIAPKEKAQGEQEIDVFLRTLPDDPTERLLVPYFYSMSIEVRPMSGVNPILFAQVALVGSLISGGVTILKMIYDMLPKSSPHKEEKPKKVPKGKRER